MSPRCHHPPAELWGLGRDRANEGCCERAAAGRRRWESGVRRKNRLFGRGEEARVFLLQEAVCTPRNLPAGNGFQQTGVSSCSHRLDFWHSEIHMQSVIPFPMPAFPSLLSLLLHLRNRVGCTSSKTTHIFATFNKEVPKKRKKCVRVSLPFSGRVSTIDTV